MALIEIRNVWKQYLSGEEVIEALGGVEISIEAGEFITIMGQSGSGKSTLLSVLGGMNHPTSGEVEMAGEKYFNEGRELVDEKVLEGLRELQAEGEPDFLTELIDIYLEDAARLVEEMKSALAGGHGGTASRAAHTLKSSSGNMGAHTLSRMCLDLELAAKEGDLGVAQAVYGELAKEFVLVRERLMKERQTDGN